ncbi:hypothetical protein L7F22_013158 [Adiantum nelumboides]|nr:hypothetical protein [Adiantum nelumboides]
MNSAGKSGWKMDFGEPFRTIKYADSDCYNSITRVSVGKHGLGSYIVGLDVLQTFVSSPWGMIISHCLEASQATVYFPSLWSFINSADTLTGNIMRRVSQALHDVMVKFTELELLRSESGSSQAAQPKAKKEGRRKKSKNPENNSQKMKPGDEVGAGLLRQQEICNSATFDLTKLEEEHEKGEKFKGEKCKPSKKKRHGRERLSESSGIRPSDEARLSPSLTCKEEAQSSYEQNFIVKRADLLLADNNSNKELSTSQTPKADDCHLSKVNSLTQRLDPRECNLSSFNNTEPCKAQDNDQNQGKVGEDFCEQERGLSNKDVEIGSLAESSLDQATAVCTPLVKLCCVKNEGTVKSTETVLPTDVANTNLGERCSSMEVSDTQSVSPLQNNLYHASCLSRSLFSSHTSRERYWESVMSHTINSKNSTLGFSTAHEWPGTFQVHFSRGRSHVISPATERLHLDVGRNWQQRLQASFMALRNPLVKMQPATLSNQKRSSNLQANVKASNCAPIFSPGYAANRSYSCGFREETAVLQSAFPIPFASPDLSMLARSQDDVRHDDRTPDDTDYDEANYCSGDFDDHEGYIISEEENERQLLDMETHGEGDYNQYFGGGVMFWNTADYAGTGYSRPPSLSSEDSSWARHEADLSVVLDDIMGFPPIPSSYTAVANPGLVSTSPPPPTYLSGFEHGVPVSGNEFGKFCPLSSVPSKKLEDEKLPSDIRKGGQGGPIDGAAPDLVSIPLLRPIIVVRDSQDSIRHHEARSPHVQRRRELPWQRRPPSPVLRCVPPSPPPPPPSPVSEFGKRKGLNTARSGSSSPRRWGIVYSSQKEIQDVPFVLSEVLESAWDKRNLREKASLHPISGSLLRERLFSILPLGVEKDHPDIALPMQTTLLFNSDPSLQLAITRLHTILHKDIEGFCKQVAAENLLRKPSISAAIDKVTHAMQVLWPRSRLKVFGSTATGLALPCSDVDLVVCLPPVRNLEPIKEAGILEGRNGIKETCLQVPSFMTTLVSVAEFFLFSHAARYLADQDWVKSDTLKTIENTTIPIIMLVAHVGPHSDNAMDIVDCLEEVQADREKAASKEGNGPWGGSVDREFVRLDISFEAPSHTGLRTAELVRELTAQFPAITPLALVLKQFLTDRSLDHPYTGGLSSYCLVILITRFLQHQHHIGCPFQQNLGSLLMDFLHFFGYEVIFVSRHPVRVLNLFNRLKIFLKVE